ncbi:MAG: arginine repressor [Acidobacteriota bacterium]|nr:arginine repressor [Acidobacteriota bacterium]
MSGKPVDKAILEIVTENRLRDQRGILKELLERGFDINQSTLSRHLRKLKIRKVDGYYRYTGDRAGGLTDFQQVLKVIPVPPNLLVVKTLPGHANAVSWHLDERGIEGVEGTVAGDDNVFIAVRPPEELENLRKQIAHIFHVD